MERPSPLAGISFAVGLVSAIGLALTCLSCKAETKPRPAQPSKATPPAIAGCQIFPADNPWNTDISGYPLHPNSESFIETIGPDTGLHPDFGTIWQGHPNGIPFVVVSGDQPKVPVSFRYAEESDPGPYPIPDDAPIEGGPESDGDRHIIVLDKDNCRLYEIWRAFKTDDGWRAGGGAVFDLTSNTLRPLGWTSADAAGLPLLPGLARYEEVAAGEIAHALRFTVRKTQRGYILPATHFASRSSDPNLPPMGLRVRLKADYDVSGFPPQAQVILRALKRYGMILADNGGDWYISGAPNPKWDDEQLSTLRRVKGSDLEVVDTGPIITS